MERRSDLLVGSIPHTSDLVRLLLGSSVAVETSSICVESTGLDCCPTIDSDVAGTVSSLSRLFAFPSIKMAFHDRCFFLLESTTTYMESPSNPMSRHSKALSSNLFLVSSATLM